MKSADVPAQKEAMLKGFVILLIVAAPCGCEHEKPRLASIPIKPETFAQRWGQAGADRDARLWRTEAGTGYMPGVQADFDAMDANEGGFVARLEHGAYREKAGEI